MGINVSLLCTDLSGRENYVDFTFRATTTATIIIAAWI